MSTLETLEICFQANLNGVTDQLNALSERLGQVETASLRADAGLRKAGEGLSEGLIQVLRNSESSLVSLGKTAAARYAKGVRTGIPEAIRAGSALTEGFAQGIGKGSSAVEAAVKKIANQATNKLKTLLSIHSPSKVTEAYGAYFTQGFADGIRSSLVNAEKAAGALGLSAVRSLQQSELPQRNGFANSDVKTVEQALERVDLTIPISVDGMKLGEASIRGINAVTRAAGKLMLNL